MIQKIKQCRSCGSEKIETFFDLGEQPYANALLNDPDENEKSYPLQLSWCSECSLVQLNHTADSKELFSNYFWVTSTSSTARNHAGVFCEESLRRVDIDENNIFVLEIASNDGTFLKPFLKKGIRALGIDPAENVVKMAIKEGVPTECGFFGQSLAAKIVSDHGSASLIIARNVVPHVSDLHDLFEGIVTCLSDDGLVILELHYGKLINQELQYDSIYHEHLCYFTIKSAMALLRRHGLTIIDINNSVISGGAVILYISKNDVQPKSIVDEYLLREEQEKVNELSSWSQFAENSARHGKEFKALVEQEKQKGRKVAAYGASARSSTLLNYCGVTNEHITLIADQNQIKQGKYTVGTHIPIVSPQEMIDSKPDTIVILAWNFYGEIIRELKEKYGYSGRIITPLPRSVKVVNVNNN